MDDDLKTNLATMAAHHRARADRLQAVIAGQALGPAALKDRERHRDHLRWSASKMDDLIAGKPAIAGRV